jgi:hypothetical protein
MFCDVRTAQLKVTDHIDPLTFFFDQHACAFSGCGPPPAHHNDMDFVRGSACKLLTADPFWATGLATCRN